MFHGWIVPVLNWILICANICLWVFAPVQPTTLWAWLVEVGTDYSTVHQCSCCEWTICAVVPLQVRALLITMPWDLLSTSADWRFLSTDVGGQYATIHSRPVMHKWPVIWLECHGKLFNTFFSDSSFLRGFSFRRKARAKNGAYYGPGRGPIWLRHFRKCRGTEVDLWHCHTFPSVRTCFHSEDVGVTCRWMNEWMNCNETQKISDTASTGN